MKQYKLIKRYTKALVSIVEDSEYQQIRMQLKQLSEYGGEITKLFENPIVSKDSKVAFISELKENIELNDNLVEFLRMLSNNNRMRLLADISEHFVVMMNERLNKSFVIVETKHELSSSLMDELKSILEKKFSNEIILEQQINDEIKGGFLIKNGDMLIDFTLNNQLSRLRENIYEAVLN